MALTLANIATGPGVLYWAPLGTALPTSSVTGSVFTDAWPSGWVALGATKGGSAFNYQLTTDTIMVEEVLDVVRYVTTGRTGSFTFELAEVSPTNLKRALNGGTIATTGTTTTTMSTYTPPAIGSEVRSMIGWQSDAADERLIAPQCFQSGQVTVNRNKGANYATIPVTFNLEVPAAGGSIFTYVTAGAVRV